MIRLSVTDLDGYLYWRESDMGLDELIARLKGSSEPTQAMLAGRAFHKLLEHADAGSLDEATVDGYTFEFALDQEIALPAIRELKAEHPMRTSVGPVTLVGKVDALNGTTVHDYKLTEKFDAERYTDSYQWRSYLTMFGAKTFVYDVFVGRYDDTRVVIYDYHRIQMHAYPGMDSDVHREVTGLAEIVAKYVPEKVRVAA